MNLINCKTSKDKDQYPQSMAYFMHVDWNWIKQRPHFLAEGLSSWFDLDLYFIKNYKQTNSLRNEMTSRVRSVQKIIKVPFSSRHGFLQFLEGMLNYTKISNIYKNKYDYVWITSPIVLQFLDIHKISESFIVYDCMDDILAFPQNERARNFLNNLEQLLLQRADIVFVSSNILGKKMIERGAPNKKVHLLNNAISTNFIEQNHLTKKNSEHRYSLFSIVYFGTIAEWFDFPTVIELLTHDKNVQVVLIGPIETEVPKHERLHVIGPVQHSKLKEYAELADAFIMPFIVDELVEAVDPVKVYEYLSFGKPSFIVRYGETLKFEPYVYLFSGANELIQLVSQVKNHEIKRVSMHDVKEFIKKNTWECRLEQVIQILGSQNMNK